MNFYDSLSFNWSFARFYGLNYFTNHQNKLQITRKSFIKGIIPGISFVLSSIIGLYTVRMKETNNQSFDIGSILLIVGQIGIVVQFTNGAVILLLAFFRRKELIKFYETVYKLDDVLVNKLEINLEYKKMKNVSSTRLSLAQLAFFIISFIIDCVQVQVSNESYILVLIIYNYSAGLNVMGSSEYLNGSKIIKYRFKSLNELLATSQVITANDLEKMIQCHLTLNGLITSMNKIYGSRQLSSITNDFVIIVVQLYSFFLAIDYNFNDDLYVKFLYGSLALPLLMSKIYFTSTTCQKVLSHKNKFGRLLKKFENSKHKESLEVSFLVNIYLIKNKNSKANRLFFFFRLTIFDYMNFILIISLQHLIFSTLM